MINYFPVSFKSTILRTYFSLRSRAVERFRRHPAATQREQLERLLRECAHTAFGQRYGFEEIRTPEAFAQRSNGSTTTRSGLTSTACWRGSAT